MGDTVPLRVDYDESGNPTQVHYYHITYGMMKFKVENGVASVHPEYNRMDDSKMAEGYTNPISTGDVYRSVKQLPFVDKVECPDNGQ